MYAINYFTNIYCAKKEGSSFLKTSECYKKRKLESKKTEGCDKDKLSVSTIQPPETKYNQSLKNDPGPEWLQGPNISKNPIVLLCLIQAVENKAKSYYSVQVGSGWKRLLAPCLCPWPSQAKDADKGYLNCYYLKHPSYPELLEEQLYKEAGDKNNRGSAKLSNLLKVEQLNK